MHYDAESHLATPERGEEVLSSLIKLYRPDDSSVYSRRTSATEAHSLEATSFDTATRWAEKKQRGKSSLDPGHPVSPIDDVRQRQQCLLKLCYALMLYGAPTHRLEECMGLVARALEVEAQFLHFPSCMIVVFDDSWTHTSEIRVVRAAQDIDLGKLRDAHKIYKLIVHGKIEAFDALEWLEEIAARGDLYPVWLRVLMCGGISMCAAPVAFGGRLIDLPPAFLLGTLVGVCQYYFAANNELYGPILEVMAALITSFGARAFGSLQNGELFCFSTLAQCPLALILPGYMILCSSLELQSRNIVAGAARLVYTMIYTLLLGYGLTIGASVYGIIDSNASSAPHCINPLDRKFHIFFVCGFTFCTAVICQANLKQTPVMLVMAISAFMVSSACSLYFVNNSQIPNLIGALMLGLLANLYSRLGRHMSHAWLEVTEWLSGCFTRRPKRGDVSEWPLPNDPGAIRLPRKSRVELRKQNVGYSLAAAAMLPAIFVMVPGSVAAGGSFISSIAFADQIAGDHTNGTASPTIDSTGFTVLFRVLQVALSLSVGLFLSALIVYPLGKRRSGIFAF